MTIAGIITMTLSIGFAWTLLIACAMRINRKDDKES